MHTPWHLAILIVCPYLLIPFMKIKDVPFLLVLYFFNLAGNKCPAARQVQEFQLELNA